MQDVLSPTVGRADFLDWYRRNRKRSTELFDMIDPQAYHMRPIPLRHPIVFYEGHLPAFSFNTLARNACGVPSIDVKFEKLFERGIDPADERAAAAQSISSWPTRDEIRAFGHACDDAVIALLKKSDGWMPGDRALQAAYTILEHEQMHHETLLYIYHRLPYELKKRERSESAAVDAPTPRAERVLIPTGTATLGARRETTAFGWDNEFCETLVEVPDFAIDSQSITNADYLTFVEAGGPAPPFWASRGDRRRLTTMFEEIDLPLSWPVYVSHDQAEAYAVWKGMRLPSEAEFHRAAYGTPGGAEGAHPWGSETPDQSRGNFGFRRFDPEPAGVRPAGASAWGIYDLVGNGWEWTSTLFEPFPGFEPMATYPRYSADFFDGQHYVVKGASPVTAVELIRRSFRNWYRPNYPYVYAKFRCAASR